MLRACVRERVRLVRSRHPLGELVRPRRSEGFQKRLQNRQRYRMELHEIPEKGYDEITERQVLHSGVT